MDDSPAWRKNVGNAPRSSYPTMNKLPQVYPMSGSLGPYELVCELGSGGMGTVYAARRCYEGNITRTVVIKTLRSDLQQRKDLVELFLEEARLIAKLHHPFVCPVTDVGIVDGIPYVAMEYLVGEPLSRLVPLMAKARGETAVAATVRIIADLCEGLHAAHELRDSAGKPLGLVHRDISPDNLFVMYDGTVRLMDFGIALTTELQNKGRAGVLAGKCAYMSPQQLRCERLDRRTDIWSMGVVLWEMLTGKRLFFRSSEVRTATMALTMQIPAPSTLNALLPPNLDAVVMHALTRDADQRYANARELANALHSVMSTALVPMSAAKLGKFVDALFPGRQDFWRRIVPHSRELMQDSGPVSVPPDLFNASSLEFDPLAQGVPDVRILDLSESALMSATPDRDEEPLTMEPLTMEPLTMEPLTMEPLSVVPAIVAPAIVAPAGARSREPDQALPNKASFPRSARITAAVFALLSLTGLAVFAGGRSASAPTESTLAAQPATSPATPPAQPKAAETEQPPSAELAANPVPPAAEVPQSPADVAQVAELKSAPDTSAESVEERRNEAPASSTRKSKHVALGEIYVSTRRKDVYVLVSGTPVHAPALIKLAIGKQSLTVLRGRDEPQRLNLTVNAKKPLMVDVD